MTSDGSRRWGAETRCGPNRHVPVLLPEIIAAIRPADHEHYLDATFGAGGYTRAILQSAGCRVTALDRDPEALSGGEAMVSEFAGRLRLIEARFGDLAGGISELEGEVFDGVVLDIGVSSMQLDQPARGFSFQSDGPLDMRMATDGGREGPETTTAADLVNKLDEKRLADLIYVYGEERRSRAIAAAIVRQRTGQPFTRTRQLADVVARAYGRPPKDGKHPATRTFQALRIATNDELGELARALAGAERVLRPGGRLVVVTFHSLEDRIVKRFFAERSGRRAAGSRHRPDLIQDETPTFQNVNHRPLTPGNQEIANNPRARSAKLRAGERTDAPARPIDAARLGVPDIDLD